MKIVCSIVCVEMLEALHEHLMHFHLCKDYGLCVGELTDESFYEYYDKNEFKALLLEDGAWGWSNTIELIQASRSDFEAGWKKGKKYEALNQTSKHIQWMQDYTEAYKENKRRMM